MNGIFTEKRVINKVCSYWNSIKNDRNFPNIEDIDYSEIIELLPYCFFLSISYMGEDEVQYTFKNVGSEVLNEYEIEDNMSFSSLEMNSSHMPPIVTDLLVPYLDEVLETKDPLITGLEYENRNGEYVKLRLCLLPLGDKNQITDILCAVRLKKE